MDIPKIVHSSWHSPLAHLWRDVRLEAIQKQLRFFKFSPVSTQIFRAFSLPLNQVRVVIMTLSPYSQVCADGTLYATGLAMGTPHVDTETLKSIRAALFEDFRDITSEGLDLTLEHWHGQGVMLLNKALTVTQNSTDAREHVDMVNYGRFKFPGWSWFTRGAIEAIDKECNGVVFCFLGKDAQEYKSLVSRKNYVITAPHPVARYYQMRRYPGKAVDEGLDFSKSGIFRKINEITTNIDKATIKWF